MTVHIVSITVPFPEGPKEAATGGVTIRIRGLGRWAGSRVWEATSSCQSWKAWTVWLRSLESLKRSPRNRKRLFATQKVESGLCPPEAQAQHHQDGRLLASVDT